MLPMSRGNAIDATPRSKYSVSLTLPRGLVRTNESMTFGKKLQMFRAHFPPTPKSRNRTNLSVDMSWDFFSISVFNLNFLNIKARGSYFN